jgi:hypothetical protein
MFKHLDTDSVCLVCTVTSRHFYLWNPRLRSRNQRCVLYSESHSCSFPDYVQILKETLCMILIYVSLIDFWCIKPMLGIQARATSSYISKDKKPKNLKNYRSRHCYSVFLGFESCVIVSLSCISMMQV